MTQTNLISEISSAMDKAKVLKLSRALIADNFDLKELVDLTFYQDKTIAFHAAWLLENMLLANMVAFINSVPYIISRIKDITNPSCQRHYAKILMHLTATGAPSIMQRLLKTIDLEPVIEQCFDWMIDPKVKVAVKALAAGVLFNMCHRHPWISGELNHQLKFLMRDGSAAIQSKGKRLLSNLYERPIQ